MVAPFPLHGASSPGSGSPATVLRTSDVSTYRLPAERVLVFRQNFTSTANSFQTFDEVRSVNADSADPSAEDRYSILSTLESFRLDSGDLHLEMLYPLLGQELEWTQTSNPMTAANDTVDGFSLINSAGGDASTFGGLANVSGLGAWLNGNPNASDWWFAAAGRLPFQSGLPAFHSQGDTPLVEIYAHPQKGRTAKVFSREDGSKYAFDGSTEIDLPNGETPDDWERVGESEVDPIGVNEFIHNIRDFRLVFAHENTGTTLTANVNGQALTYENLANATDQGDGGITLANNTNGTYSSRANSVETLAKVDEYFEFTVGGVGQFRTTWIALSDDVSAQPELALPEYRISLASGGFSLRNKKNEVIASGGQEAGTYRFTRTLYGFKIEKDGEELYRSPVVVKNYNTESNVTVQGSTGLYRIAEHRPAAPIVINSTTVLTGFDLTQAAGMMLKLFYQDAASGRSWAAQEIDVDSLLERFAAGDAVDHFAHIFDNDYSTVNVVTAETGEILLADVGREMAYLRSELWIAAPQHVDISPVDASLVAANDGAPVTIEIDQAQSANGICTISDMTLERRGALGTLRFQLGHDRDDETVYEFAALLPADAKLVGAPVPVTDNVAHEIPTEVGYRRVSDTAIAINRSNAINDVCNFWFELTFSGVGG